ncbi:MAG TPA: plastocyanin/azurin family copper-binding protein [Gemmatimonadales bacterium]|nr:plastocyanin/azurin family copper-binding protein [Gemmatimonadales bacterium]
MIRKQAMALLVGVAALACNSDSTQPPGPPDHLVKSGGDQQEWYFNNPLPVPYSVSVLDANDRPVPGVSVAWSPLVGSDGSFSSNPSTTNSSGVATTIHTLGTATMYVVNVVVTGVPTTQFTAKAAAPGTAVGVSVTNNAFTPRDTAVQTGGTVTWTWNSGTTLHNVTYTGGPTPLPTSSSNQSGTTTFSTTFTAVGKYTYHCTIHPTQMTGSVTVVH